MISADAQIERAVRALGLLPGAAGRAAARALNVAMAEGISEAVSAISGRYSVDAGAVRRRLGFENATPTKPTSALSIRARALSLGNVPHVPNVAGTGGPGRPQLRAEVIRGAWKRHRGAFVAPARNGGLRIFRRAQGTTSSGKGRLEAVYTLGLAQMLATEEVREQVESKALAVLDERMDTEIDRELGRGERA